MMKKWIPIAAVLTVGSLGMPSVSAANGAQLYGIAEVGLGYDNIKVSRKNHSNFGVRPGGSRFGLTGSEALGSDLTVRYTLEAGFDIATGKGSPTRIFSREATLGMAHKHFGSIDVGRHYNFSALYTGAVDPFGGGYGLSGLDTTVGTGVRVDNLVLYQTPNWAGFEGGVGYSFDVDEVSRGAENKKFADGAHKDKKRDYFNNSTHTRLFTTGMQYGAGPLKAMFAYDKVFRRSDAPGKERGTTLEGFVLGAAYAFTPVTLYATVSQTYDGWMSGKNMSYMPDDDRQFKSYHYAKGFSATTGMIGARMDVGRHRYMVSWQHAQAKNKRLTGHDKPFNMYSVGYRYELSKRTELTGFLSYGLNYAFVDKLDGMQTALRIRHRF